MEHDEEAEEWEEEKYNKRITFYLLFVSESKLFLDYLVVKINATLYEAPVDSQ